MKINVLGSKLVADASARSHKRIELDNRIVDLSLFSCLQESSCLPFKSNYEFHSDNDYLNKLMGLDLYKEIACLINTDVTLVIDLMAARMEFYQFTFKDGSKHRLTKNRVTESEFEEIKSFFNLNCKGIEDVKIVNPINYTLEEIYKEVELFCKQLEALSIKKIVLVKGHCTYQYFDTNGQYCVLSNHIELVERYNAFFDICNNLFMQFSDCIAVELPKHLFGEEKVLSPNIFAFNHLYYEYIIESLLEIDKCSAHLEDGLNDLLYRYNNRINLLLDQYKYKFLPGHTMNNRRGRRIVLIGNARIYELLLCEIFGIIPDIIVPYDDTDTEETMRKKLEDFSYKNEDYMCIIPYIYKNTGLLRALWRNGFGNGIGYYLAIHKPIKLRGFCGHYEDFWGNIVDSKSAVNLDINGISNTIKIETDQMSPNCMLTVLNNCNISISKNVSSEECGFTGILYDDAKLEINEGVFIGGECHFRLSFFSNTIIGMNSHIGERSVLFNGDGHSIFYLYDGKNHNYDLNNSLPRKHEIVIGEHVWIGKKAFILSGSFLHDNVFIEDGEFVNKECC